MITNPFKGKLGWHLAQNIYTTDSEIRSLKAGSGSDNIPKILLRFK